jgi:putative ABC transport system permease protein
MQLPAAAVVGALVAGSLLATLYQAIRRPILRKLAVRDAVRRPSETVLVVAGSLLGTALITGSLIVGDTLDSSIRASATTQLGPVDEVLVVGDSRRAEAIEQQIEAIDDDSIDGVMSLVSVPAAVASGSRAHRLAEPAAQLIEADFDEAREFGGDPAATGITGATPGSDEVVVTDDLARTLKVDAGDTVTAYLYGSDARLEVARVLPRLGVAGYWRGTGTKSSNAFVSPGTLDPLVQEHGLKGVLPPQASVLVSNKGGVEEGADLTRPVTSLIEHALGSDAPVRVEPAKKDVLETAREQGDQFTELFVAIGAFAIVAGVLLLINIFVMLAEERKAQLGMLRAVGMRRADLVRGFIIEGTIYALVASAVGAVLGIGVGWAIVKLAAPIFSSGGDFALQLSFAAEPGSIVAGFCIGLLISLVSITFTSVRLSSINIIGAIRDLPEVRGVRGRRRTLIAGLLLAAAGASMLATGLRDERAWFPAIMGPPVIAFGLLPLLTRLIGRRIGVLLAASVSLLWGIFGNTITDGHFFESGEIFAFVVQGVSLTFAAVVLLSQSHETFGGVLRKVAARRLPLRLGLAYPLARRFRTGLTLGMYSLVVFTMVFLSSMSASFLGQIQNFTAKEAGGFDLIVDASQSNPPEPERLASLEGVDEVAALFKGQALYRPDGFSQPEPWPVTGANSELVRVGPPELEERPPGFDRDAEVWSRLLEDPHTAVIDNFFLQTGGGPPEGIVEPGDTMKVIDPVTGAAVERRVIGVLSSDSTYAGVFMSQRSVAQILAERAVPARFYVKAAGTESQARDLGIEMQGRFIRNGVEARTFRELVEEQFDLQLQFFNLMQGYLALGLLVGIAGLGVVMIRSVRERRREIGVLRSLGFPSSKVRIAFLLESGFVALEGTLVGSVLALVTASQLMDHGDFGEGIAFVIPWISVIVLTSSALLASLLATTWPAQQASRIAPAVALRVAD